MLYSFGAWLARLRTLVLILGLLGLAAACSVPPATSTVAPAQYVAGSLKPLRIEPSQGNVHDPFTITGEGLPPGKSVNFEWGGYQGEHVLEASSGNAQFLGSKFTEKRAVLGRAAADDQGRITATFVAPEDFGGSHDIFAVADGQDIARGAFRTLSTVMMSPTEGPVGTPIIISVRGVSRIASENTLAVLYDNKYTGIATAVVTKGSAIIRMRAAGPVGPHTVQLAQAAPGNLTPNLQGAPGGRAGLDARWTFAVTKDDGPPPSTMDWPSGSRVSTLSDAVPKTKVRGIPTGLGAGAGLEAPYGTSGATTSLWARGLPPNAELDLLWVTTRGQPGTPAGQSLTEVPVGKATTNADGSLRASIQVPDSPGGWHVVKAVKGGTVLVETPYYVQYGLADPVPQRVKEGQSFKVKVKGLGWTEVDSALAITYDNAYIGYAYSTDNTGGATITLTATGGPGTHLIDLYPTVHRLAGKGPSEDSLQQLPLLTALQDHPGQRLGYELPIFRLAIEVVP